MTQTAPNLIDALASSGKPKRWIERKLALEALGVVAALEEKRMSVEESGDQLFNMDNYIGVKQRRLDKSIREIFEWGMELDSVQSLAPDGLGESYAAIRKFAMRMLAKRKPTRRPASTRSR